MPSLARARGSAEGSLVPALMWAVLDHGAFLK